MHPQLIFADVILIDVLYKFVLIFSVSFSNDLPVELRSPTNSNYELKYETEREIQKKKIKMEKLSRCY